MYKNIVPELVSFDTNLKSIKGLHICQNLDFFNNIGEKNKFHYEIALKNDIKIPLDYEFRNEYFMKKGNCWYYDKKIFFLHLKFMYDSQNKIFYFNKLYSIFPFRIGGIFSVGEHISDMVNFDLFVNGYIFLRGMAAQKSGKNICISTPGFNGKTVFLEKTLKSGAKYIAEDHLIMNLKEKKVYPTCPFLKNNFFLGRKIDNAFKKLFRKEIILGNSVKFDSFYLIQNSLNLNYAAKSKSFFDFVLLNSLYFLNNLFLRSYIFEQGYAHIFFKILKDMEEAKINCDFIAVKNYNLDLNKL